MRKRYALEAINLNNDSSTHASQNAVPYVVVRNSTISSSSMKKLFNARPQPNTPSLISAFFMPKENPHFIVCVYTSSLINSSIMHELKKQNGNDYHGCALASIKWVLTYKYGMKNVQWRHKSWIFALFQSFIACVMLRFIERQFIT